jgi:GNAT superfamily N-acetyltransferase
MNIKLLSVDELIIVRELAFSTWPDTFKEILSNEQINYMLEWMYNLKTLSEQVKSGHQFYVYEENSIPKGFIGIELNYPEKNQLKIQKLYVLPELQGEGIGKRLIDKAIQVANQNGIYELVLNVNRFNKAVGFYKHIGFTVSYEENIDIGNGYLMEDYVMSLKL